MSLTFAARVRGCLLGGGVGDALGAPVEFMSSGEIERRHGPSGITEIQPPGHFTDDTQMVLFTCEGLIRANVRGRSRGIAHPPSVVRNAYLRWLHTQRGRIDIEIDGWLVTDQRLHRREAPGNTCLSALASGDFGTTAEPLNDSKGCGGVMRAAPAGLFTTVPSSATYELGCDLAAITHGHPDGWHPAGALAVIVRSVIEGMSLRDAVFEAIGLTSPQVSRVLEDAVAVAAFGLPSPATIERHLGGGWVGDEALAIAVACALAAPDLRSGVVAAANHSGDTDSTAAICGNLLGVVHGEEAIPRSWLDRLDARDLVEAVADDFVCELTDPPMEQGDPWGDPPESWFERYPGW